MHIDAILTPLTCLALCWPQDELPPGVQSQHLADLLHIIRAAVGSDHHHVSSAVPTNHTYVCS